MIGKIVFTLCCLILPVVWGVIVNRLFHFWRMRNSRQQQTDEPIFPDYQI